MGGAIRIWGLGFWGIRGRQDNYGLKALGTLMNLEQGFGFWAWVF